MAYQIEVILPEGATCGDIVTAQGAIFNAAAGFVDWEALHDRQEGAISSPGLILFDVVRQLDDTARKIAVQT